VLLSAWRIFARVGLIDPLGATQFGQPAPVRNTALSRGQGLRRVVHVDATSTGATRGEAKALRLTLDDEGHAELSGESGKQPARNRQTPGAKCLNISGSGAFRRPPELIPPTQPVTRRDLERPRTDLEIFFRIWDSVGFLAFARVHASCDM
jgi:hypothetical protein